MTSTTENENIDLDLEEILEDEELEENQDDDNGILEDEEDNQTAKFDVRPTVSGVLNLRTNKEHSKFFHKGCKPLMTISTSRRTNSRHSSSRSATRLDKQSFTLGVTKP